jgi:hypothetical protein
MALNSIARRDKTLQMHFVIETILQQLAAVTWGWLLMNLILIIFWYEEGMWAQLFSPCGPVEQESRLPDIARHQRHCFLFPARPWS